MTRAEIYEIAKKCFSMSQAETDKYLNGFTSNIDKIRLQYILRIVEKYCDKFVDVSDEKLKRKVGKVILSKLDYSKFGTESTRETFDRLDFMFKHIVNKKINPYKVIYCSVLTDGNLKTDYENNNRYYDKNRDFQIIYNRLKGFLHTTDAETVALFEKCSTLISKVSGDRVKQVYECLKNLSVGSEDYFAKIFEPQEVIEILKINPSLFTASNEKIYAAVRYLEKKASNQIKNNLKPLYPNHNINVVANKRQLLRSWIKNNTSLLTLNAESMRTKEYYLQEFVAGQTKTDYQKDLEKTVNNIFNDRINLALISQIPHDKIVRNAFDNILLLEKIATPKQVAKYVEDNPLVFGMKNEKLSKLIDKIVQKAEYGSEYLDKFLEFGRTLFASNIDFDPNDIFEKLTTNQAMIKLDTEKISGKDSIEKFAEVFMDGNQDIVFEIEDLIKEKQARETRGEKALRKRIRYVGGLLEDIPAIVKDKAIKNAQKRDIILAYAEEVKGLQNARFSLANSADFEELRKTEQANSEKIENLLNKLRDIFEQKRFKVGKKYKNADILFENMMDYLGTCFDDKEAISEVYSKEVAQKFVDIMKGTFNSKDDIQLGIFETNTIISDADPNLVSPLKHLTSEVEKGEKADKLKHIVFNKN